MLISNKQPEEKYVNKSKDIVDTFKKNYDIINDEELINLTKGPMIAMVKSYSPTYRNDLRRSMIESIRKYP